MKQIVGWKCLLLILNCLKTVTCAKEQQPNIVLVVADDYGYRDIGYHGAEFATPTLNKLAAEGVKLENYYVQPICSPTRSQLMTGRYQIHTGLQHDIIWPSQPNGLPLQFPTIADLLKSVGYSTHAIGKWHLGFYKKEYTPLYRGFDSFYGYWEGGEDYYTYYHCDSFHNRSTPTDMRILQGYTNEDILSGKYADKKTWCGYDLRDMSEPVTNMNGTYSTHLYTKRAIDVINRSKNAGKPFFLYLAYQAVHAPMEVPAEYTKPYAFIKNKNRRIYAGMVSAMDEGVRNVTEALKSTGLWNNTVFIFTTDNGGQVHAGGNNWPLRGLKHTLWEGGVRGIGFVTGPLVQQQGKVSEELMHVSDWFPTIAEAVGVQINGTLKLDGQSQWQMISKGSLGSRKEILHNIDIWTPLKGKMLYNDTFDTRVRAAIRVGDFKLVTGHPGDDTWYPPPHLGNPKVAKTDSTKNCWLFNVKLDPTESSDLSDTRPDLVQELLNRLVIYNSTAVPPLYPQSDPNCDPKLHGGFWGPWE
ncbi:unnamed protein product [Candidula unifasciata]|uniref:Sulfatase N-terminal domain-containing protein n=1 Tax=Candidula unifasciata TaxID=100452 RepID=A0A8S3YDG6_9EUPU|nr:unnamed protein product [Candidula unifasciata]